MDRTRRRTLALLAALSLALGLPAGMILAHSGSAQPTPAAELPAVAQDRIGGQLAADEDEDAGPPEGTHGAEVSAVARDPEAVAGPNDNHGGAVSEVARGDHGKPDSTGKPDSAGRPDSAGPPESPGASSEHGQAEAHRQNGSH